tara:strand:+ start:99 stop:503 length:405 start_codon:yes stop_codon:yes gene_type:complete
MAKIIIYDDGEKLSLTRYLSPTKTIEEVAKKIYGEKPYLIINEIDLPSETDFVDAWIIKNDKVVISMDRAKTYKKHQLRLDRKALLEEQDILFMKALESNSDTSAIIAEKQRLRDITKGVDGCKTTKQLNSIIL